jgi:hypothetical protein
MRKRPACGSVEAHRFGAGGVDWGTLGSRDAAVRSWDRGASRRPVWSASRSGAARWLERRLGFACDSLIRADVVTADSDVVIATESEATSSSGVERRRQLRCRDRAVPAARGKARRYAGLAFRRCARARVITTWRDIPRRQRRASAGSLPRCAHRLRSCAEEWRGKRMWAVLGLYWDRGRRARESWRRCALRPIVDLCADAVPR